MTTYLKRIGSIATKFLIYISLKEININISPALVCKVSIVLKRGLSFFRLSKIRNHLFLGTNKVEIESPSILTNKHADLQQNLSLKTTLYFDHKLNIYHDKKAILDIILIFPNEKKLAGTLKINLAHYANYYMNS
jgi:hypothetical protein